MKREFLMLAGTYKKHDIGGWYWSEKLDGTRCFWDGGVSVGRRASEVPWANTEKDFRLNETVVSTGLWSRYGKVIRAPKWWLDNLPSVPLDGELWIDRGKFQLLRSIITTHNNQFNDSLWKAVKYVVFDTPKYETIFADGLIDNVGMFKTIEWNKCRSFIGDRETCEAKTFEGRYHWLKIRTQENDIYKIHTQERLPLINVDTFIDNKLKEINEQRGEGIIVRNINAAWEPARLKTLLKIKPFIDSEATVTGYIWGEGKLAGLMGAMIVNFNGKRLELSGFTDAERELTYTVKNKAYICHPKTEVDSEITSVLFPRGSTVTFRYRELSDSLVPKEARFLRKYETI